MSVLGEYEMLTVRGAAGCTGVGLASTDGARARAINRGTESIPRNVCGFMEDAFQGGRFRKWVYQAAALVLRI